MVFGLKLGQLGSKKTAAEPPSSEPVSSGKSGSSGAKSALTVNEFVARTKKHREKGLEPTKPELIAYARYLGIDPIVDGDLMWIADEALRAPLPSEWTEHHDSADRVFYYNVQTHASSWTHPLEHLHRDTYKCIVNFRSGDLSKEDRGAELDKMRRKVHEAEEEAHRELQAWSEHTDEQGQKFYYNREHQRSVWTDPRPARCHALYLQMKALRVLSKQLGQAAPAPRRGLEPLGGAEHASDSDRSPRPEDLLPRNPGRSKKDKMMPLSGLDGTEGAGQLGGLDVSPWGGGGFASEEMSGKEGGRKRHKRKKRHGEDRAGEAMSIDMDHHASRPGEAGGLGALNSVAHQPQPIFDSSPHPGSLGALPDARIDAGEMKSSLLDMKRPSLSAVEEVRSAIGGMDALGGAGTRLPPMGGLGGRSFGANDRLPSPPGDGLSSVGRTKVRAGIRLDPLR
jgi:hypothetical protein